MNNGNVLVYYGDGKGKSTAALGHAVRMAGQGKTAIIISFLKGKNDGEQTFFRRLEPEIKFFRFEKSQENYDKLSEEEKQEERMNIKNGLNFAKKVLVTGECNVLILDEFLGLLDKNLVTEEELKSLFAAKSHDTQMIFTGNSMVDSFRQYADEIYRIEKS